MPIIKPAKNPVVGLPPALLEQAQAALFYQVVSSYHEEQYKETKSALFGIIAAESSGVILEIGKSLRFEGGLLRWQGRSNHTVDTDAIAAAVQSGKVSVEAVLSCVGKFNAAALATLCPNAVTDADPTEFGVMQATPDYKRFIVSRIEENDRILAAAGAEAARTLEAQAEAVPVRKRSRKPVEAD